MESPRWSCWRNEEGKSDPPCCHVKAGLCVCWAGPVAHRAQSSYCLFGKSGGILLQLFMEGKIWCFWKSLGVGGCPIFSRSLNVYEWVLHDAMGWGVWSRETESIASFGPRTERRDNLTPPKADVRRPSSPSYFLMLSLHYGPDCLSG